MLIHFRHLLWQCLVDFPGLLSGNWLGTIFLPLALFALFEIKPLRRGWSAMTTEAKREFWRNSCILAGIYLLLFAWVVVRDVYNDHQDLVHRIREFKSPEEIDAQIAGFSTGGANHNNDEVLVALIRLNNNSERPRPISNWKMQVLFNSVLLEQSPLTLPGPEWKIPMRNSKGQGQMVLEESKFCPQITENPLPGGANRECWFIGRFAGRYKALDMSQFKLIVSFHDGLTRKTQTMERVVLPTEGNLF